MAAIRYLNTLNARRRTGSHAFAPGLLVRLPGVLRGVHLAVCGPLGERRGPCRIQVRQGVQPVRQLA